LGRRCYRKDSEKEMKLKEGEVLCSKCKGKGLIENTYHCDKCDGVGKLDWVSNAMGGVKILQNYDFENQTQKIISDMAKSLSDEIDKDILKCLVGKCKKRRLNDNRIIS